MVNTVFFPGKQDIEYIHGYKHTFVQHWNEKSYMRSVKDYNKGVEVAYKLKRPLNANIFTTEHTWFTIFSTPCNMSCTDNYIRIHAKFTTQTLKIYHVSLHNFPHSPLTHCPQTQFIIFFKWISHFSTKQTLATYHLQPPYIFNNNYIHKHGIPSFAYCTIIAMDALFSYFQTTVSCAAGMVNNNHCVPHYFNWSTMVH